MAKSPIERTLDKIGNVVQDIFTGAPEPPVVKPMNASTKGQTCLEKFGFEQRKAQLMNNEWRKDLEYSKPLVLAEYDIQTEFKVSTADDDVATQLMNTNKQAQERALRAQEKARKKAEKKVQKELKKQNKVAGVPDTEQPGGLNTKDAPVETTTPPEKQYDWTYYARQTGYLPPEDIQDNTNDWTYYALQSGYLPPNYG